MPRDKDIKRVVRKRMTETGERYTDARAALRPRGAQRSTAKRKAKNDAATELVEVEIPVHGGIRMHLATGQHCVVLKQLDGDGSLPIWIGITEANAIAVALSDWAVERPLTSDLLTSTIAALGGTVERVVITRIVAGCFYAEVHVHRDGVPLQPMDARPSDALGIAVRTHAPIFVARDVMNAGDCESGPPPDAVTPELVRTRTAAGAEGQAIAFAPVVEPTHMLIDVASNRVLTLLRFPPRGAKQPEVGTLVTVGTPQAGRQYRVVAVEPGTEGITRLRAELVANPTRESSVLVTEPPSRAASRTSSKRRPGPIGPPA